VRFLEAIQSQRERTRRSLAESCVYAGQAVFATLVILWGYQWAGRSGGMWAAVSAVLVLQPGFRRSLASSAIRVIANLLGVGIGALTAIFIDDRIGALCIALVLIVMVCEFARLDMGVRSACASVIIVSIGSTSLTARGIERATAVCIGCGVAIVLQLALQPLIQRFLADAAGIAGRGEADEA
jgi:uncharacterized membrane protein YgaE (UPF0421/DUF939 family)